MIRAIRGLTGAGLLVAAATAAAQNLVTNGSFESPNIGGGNFTVVASMPGWSLSSGTGFEIQNNVAGTPFAGAQHIELDGNINSGMQQVVPTVAGGSYTLSVEYSPRPGVGSASNPVEVRINGSLVATLSGDGSALADTAWTKYSFGFAATGPTTIDFRAAGTSDGVGGYIDDVQVVGSGPTAVPALSSSALATLALALALAGAALARRGKAS